jgi:hypothetical protein
MNIFYVHSNPQVAGQMLCDKHVVKMILESVQLLSTAHHVAGNPALAPYKVTHRNHPSSVWVRSNKLNYRWLYRHTLALLDEYTYRYGKAHACVKYMDMLASIPSGIPITHIDSVSPMPQCMPDVYKVVDDPVQGYRNYYKHGKKHLLQYKRRNKPEWLS